MSGTFVENDLIFEIPGVWLMDDDAHLSACRSCRAPVVWARNAASGKRAPFDPVTGAGGANLVSSNHFATCPDAAKWRKKSPVDLHVNRSEPIEERGS